MKAPCTQLTVSILVASAFLVVLGGCVTPSVSMETPDGFARYEGDADEVRIISPEGVVARVRTVPNDPPQTLEFWSEVLERHLSGGGYQLVDQSEFVTEAGDGVLFEWLAPVREDDWIYLTAIVVTESTIGIAEAAGRDDLYPEYRDALRTSLASIRFEETSE